jgi:hypothetical protein
MRLKFVTSHPLGFRRQRTVDYNCYVRVTAVIAATDTFGEFRERMSNSKAYESLSRLVVDVRKLEKVSDGFSFAGEFGPESDAMGFRLLSCSRFLFSFSTIGGSLPFGIVDMQVSIADDTLENGEICFLDEVNLADAVSVIKSYIEGRRS